MDIQSERSLILQAKKDPEAFGQLYDYYYPQIYGFVLKRTGNEDLAKDIVSETFFQAVKNLWRFKITNKPFKSWLYRIAVAQIGQYYRTKKAFCEITIDESPELIANQEYNSDAQVLEEQELEEKKLLQQNVHEVLLKLSQTQHTIIILKYFENKKIKDIAEILSMNENTVKSHIRRALKKLNKLLLKEKNFKNYETGKVLQQFRA